MSAIGNWWPAALVIWGFLRVVEITRWKSMGRPLPQNGLSGGEWIFIVFSVRDRVRRVHREQVSRSLADADQHGGEMFGESFDYPQAEQVLQGAGKRRGCSLKICAGIRGIVGADLETVKVTGG
jgi:hypothetical protein